MATVFFVFDGINDAVHDAELAQFGEWQGAEIGSQFFGVFLNASPTIRQDVNNAHSDVTVLPGPNGRLNADQAKAIVATVSSAVAGASMYDILTQLYALSPDRNALFDPDAY